MTHPTMLTVRPPAALALLSLIFVFGCGESSVPAESNAAPNAAPMSGEPYTVGDTVRLGTLIGYGKPMPADAAPSNVQSIEAGGDVVWGTDEGFITTLSTGGSERIYFFFGDTTARSNTARANPVNDVRKGVNNGDIIGYTTDTDPEDGVQLDHVLRNNEAGAAPACAQTGDQGYRSIYIPGVNNACTGNDGGVEVPTGVIALPPVYGDPQRLLMWFGKAGDLANTVAATSFIAVSDNLGYDWTALRDRSGAALVFSQGVPGQPAKFLVVNPLLVDAADFQSAASSPCQLPRPDGPDTHGLLLFSSGLYRRSDIYLAFMPLAPLLAAFADPGQVDISETVQYFAGVGAADGPGKCWSRRQADAVPIVRTSDASSYAELEAPCGNTIQEGSTGAGEFSVTHVQVGKFDRLVLLLNNGYATTDKRYGSLGPQLVTGDPHRPWIWNTLTPAVSGRSGDSPQPYRPLTIPRPAGGDDVSGFGSVCPSSWTAETTLSGYGPMLINRYTRQNADAHSLDLYFTLSRWKGTLDYAGAPYRVDLFRTTLSPAS